jgi:hypothetical protein
VSYNLLFIGATDPALLACNQPSLTGTVYLLLRERYYAPIPYINKITQETK